MTTQTATQVEAATVVTLDSALVILSRTLTESDIKDIKAIAKTKGIAIQGNRIALPQVDRLKIALAGSATAIGTELKALLDAESDGVDYVAPTDDALIEPTVTAQSPTAPTMTLVQALQLQGFDIPSIAGMKEETMHALTGYVYQRKSVAPAIAPKTTGKKVTGTPNKATGTWRWDGQYHSSHVPVCDMRDGVMLMRGGTPYQPKIEESAWLRVVQCTTNPDNDSALYVGVKPALDWAAINGSDISYHARTVYALAHIEGASLKHFVAIHKSPNAALADLAANGYHTEKLPNGRLRLVKPTA